MLSTQHRLRLAAVLLVSGVLVFVSSRDDVQRIREREASPCASPVALSAAAPLPQAPPQPSPPSPPSQSPPPPPYTRMERTGNTLHCSPVPCRFRAQDGEDRLYLDAVLRTLPVGQPLPRGPGHLIVEMGAWQGTDFSTSWVFEYALDWRVVHFEPSAQNFERLVANRPRATNIHRAACAGPEETTVRWLEQNLPGFGGGAVGGIEALMAPSFRDHFHSAGERAAGRTVPANVTCGPMWRYLDAVGVRHVDLFVLDVEGAELDALHGFRWDMVTVDTWVVEADGRAPAKDAAVAAMMTAQGYRAQRIGRNDWFSKTLTIQG